MKRLKNKRMLLALAAVLFLVVVLAGIGKLPYVDRLKCVGCGACERVCPVDTIELIDGKARIGEACISCNSCVKTCPYNAIKSPN